MIDRDFRVLAVNKAYLELTKRAGYSTDPFGKNLFEVYPFLGKKVRDEYLKVFETGKILKTEEMNTVHRTDFYTETQKVPIFEENKVIRIMTLIRDISEWKRADTFKANLITLAAHELKTPLVPILGWADYIRKVIDKGEDLNKRVERDDLLSVVRNAERLKNIVDSYLDVGRIEAGRLVLSIEQIDLNNLITSAMTAVLHQASEKGIQIQMDLGSLSFKGDAFRLEQVFINLLANAINYSPPNSRVRIRAEDLGESMKILVQDDGFGFTPQELEDVFQPFSSSVFKSKGDKIFAGSGVGLYICRRLVEAHNGIIEIRSPGPNRGTTVSVTLLKDPQRWIASK